MRYGGMVETGDPKSSQNIDDVERIYCSDFRTRTSP